MKRVFGILVVILTATVVGSAQNTSYLPQVADGLQPGGIVWTTAIAVTNPAASGTASGSISFSGDDGSAFNIGFNDELGNPVAQGSTVTFQLSGGQTRFFISTSAQNLKVGFGTITSNLPVSAGEVFIETLCTGPSETNCNSVAEAGVLAATPAPRQSTIVVEDSSTDGGVAIVNPSSSPATVTYTLIGTNGVAAYPAVTATLAANSHTAQFVSQLFPSAAGKTFYGRLQVTSATPLVMTSLTFKNSGQFATLPVITIASSTAPDIEWLETQPHSIPLKSLAALFGRLLQYGG